MVIFRPNKPIDAPISWKELNSLGGKYVYALHLGAKSASLNQDNLCQRVFPKCPLPRQELNEAFTIALNPCTHHMLMQEFMSSNTPDLQSLLTSFFKNNEVAINGTKTKTKSN